jgi:type II secretory ATPase GspE/PulE/Tfp pilus assembly ATPase PilB-like protein
VCRVETAKIAVEAALTGHLVLSTLHTNSAAGAIPRLLDMHAEPFLLVSTLSVVVGQRLVRRLEKPKERYSLDKVQFAELSKKVNVERILATLKELKVVDNEATWDKVQFWKPNPSADYPDGYHSRVGIHEVLKVTPTIRDLIMKGATSDDIEAQAKKEGMLTMFEDGIVKAVQGHTTIEEVLRVISE